MVALSKSSDRLKELEADNERLRWEIDRLRAQNDIYRFGREEAPKWKSALDIGVEILDERIVEKKRLLEKLDSNLKDLKREIAIVADRLKMQKTAAMSFKYNSDDPPVATKSDLHKILTQMSQKTPSQQLRSLNMQGAMSIIRKLFIAYSFDGQVFRYNGPKSQMESLTMADVETLLRRSLRQ